MGHWGNKIPQKIIVHFFRLWNGLWILGIKIRIYVSSVVFYCADTSNLLPVVRYQNN
jgi:hypothetical protein